MSMREVGYNARPWYGRRVTGSSSEAGDVIRIGTTEQTIRIGTIYEPVYNSSWAGIGSLTGTLQDRQAPQTQQQETNNQRKFGEAVQATRDILQGDNSCSRFFGELGLIAFNNMIQNATFGKLGNANTGIRMELTFPTYHRTNTPIVDKIAGRQFYDSITPNTFTVNTSGAFFNSDRSLPRFGGYAAGSLQSRVVQLLHELGHVTISGFSTRELVKDIVKRGFVRGEPLLKEDGDNTNLSEKNTNTVIKNCRDQIDALDN